AFLGSNPSLSAKYEEAPDVYVGGFLVRSIGSPGWSAPFSALEPWIREDRSRFPEYESCRIKLYVVISYR
ncbi:MAG: hypothetical protein ABFR53_10240, partial [Actinomycetota bacterium]